MSSFPMEVGRVVFSKAGRDAGHYFVVVAVLDKDHVAIANGCQRKVDNPKKKKIKHIQPMYRTPEGRDLTKITDVDVKRAIVLHEKEEEHVKSGCN